MSPDSLTSGWYYSKRGDSASRQGPLAWQDLYLRAQTGEFGPRDLVWNPQLSDWIPAAQIPGLFPATIAPPAAVTSRQPHQGRPGWLLPVLIPVVALVLAGAGLGAFFGLHGGYNPPISASPSTSVSSAPPTSISSSTPSPEPGGWAMAAPTVIDVPTEQVASSTVTAQGAILSYGPVKLDIPAGAVTSDTNIVVRRLTQPFHEEAATTDDPQAAAATPLGSAFDYGPAGVNFDKPVTITLPYDPGMGPNGVDPSHVAIAYWNGKQWIVAGGTADPSTNTVSVQLKAFDGSLVIVIATVVGVVLNRVITWHYAGEGTNSDPVSKGEAANYVTPTDPTVKTQASKAVLKNTTNGEVKSLTDPDLATWVADAASKKQVPTLGYQQPDGSVKTATFDDKAGSNWQTPADYFNKGTVEFGPISGDCTDTTDAAVSIFRADGFRAVGVYGYADKDKTHPHAWGEVVIGGNVYRIDEWGGIITPTSNPFNFTTYQPPDDPNDPHYKSMWSDQVPQQAYNPNWWKAASFAGTYKGEFSVPDARIGEIPSEFIVNDDGSVTSQFTYTDEKGGYYEFHLTGAVTSDGKLTASGTSTLNGTAGGKPVTYTSPITLTGQISGAEFTGNWLNGSTVRATRQ